ncbi:unnamed protein product, partial [Musa acuminata var. zebrina]
FRSLRRCIPLFSSPHSRLRLVQVGNRSIGDGTPDPSASGIRSDLHWSRRHASPLASSEFENTWRKGSSLIGFRQLVFTEGLGSGLTYCSAYICGTQSTSIRSQTCQLFHKPFSCELSLRGGTPDDSKQLCSEHTLTKHSHILSY